MARPFTTSIYKHNGQDCSNRGLSSAFDSVVVVPEGHTDPAPNAVRIVKRRMGGRVLFHAEPIHFVKPGAVGPMMGGTYINLTGYTFNLPEHPELDDFYGAVALHDRFETVEEYAHFSL
jgi:hypothetical protein